MKNRGEKPQSRYHNHHEAIVSKDDFVAVQRMLDNAKYGNKTILPELRVIDSGVFRGFVIINPRWAGFKEPEYYQAAKSVYIEDAERDDGPPEIQFQVNPGDFDLRGFEITRSEFFDISSRPAVVFENKKMKFNADCVRRFGEKNTVELMINPITRKFAIRPTSKDNRNGVVISSPYRKTFQPRSISTAAFSDTIFSLFGWNTDCKYRIIGSLLEQDGELAYIFDVENSEAFFKSYMMPRSNNDEGSGSVQPLTPSGKHIRAIPQEWTTSFGKQFYLHEQSLAALESQSEADWMLRLEGQLFETGRRPNVTGFDELKRYIRTELQSVMQ